MRKNIALAILFSIAFFTGCQQAPSPHHTESKAPQEHPSKAGHPAQSSPGASPASGSTPAPVTSAAPPPGNNRAREHKRAPSLAADRSPASVPTAAPPPAPDTDALLQQAADKLPLGKVDVNHPTAMKVNQTGTVYVRISRDQQADLTKDLAGNGNSDLKDSLPVSTSMKVDIKSDSNFKVESLDSREQLITSSGYTQWSFAVTPLQSGSLPLHVRISAIISANGVQKNKDFPVKDETIQVSVSPVAVVEGFVSNNWQWLWSTFVIPIGAWILHRRRKKKTSNGKSADHLKKSSRGQGA